ncbi:MAG: ribose 5-phosphate isomerase B [Clostridia bacterium]|nr:ribose 5-phosphate isomerase B [Clostridia bacterium]
MIALAADHGGYYLKEAIKKHLELKGIEFKDFGTYDTSSVDYPVYAEKAARAVAGGECRFGIICCGTGIGVSMTANKIKGIRAAVVTNEFCAEMTRRHNDANILCMGGRVIDENTAVKLADIFLNTPFDGGRHSKRVDMIKELEQNI